MIGPFRQTRPTDGDPLPSGGSPSRSESGMPEQARLSAAHISLEGAAGSLSPFTYFVGAIAHRLRNKLMVLGNTEATYGVDSQPALVLDRATFQSVMGGLEESSQLIESFLGFLPGDVGSDPVPAEAFLPTVLEQLHRFVQPGMGKVGQEFEIEPGSVFDTAKVSPEVVRSVLITVLHDLAHGLPAQCQIVAKPIAPDRVELRVYRESGEPLQDLVRVLRALSPNWAGLPSETELFPPEATPSSPSPAEGWRLGARMTVFFGPLDHPRPGHSHSPRKDGTP